MAKQLNYKNILNSFVDNSKSYSLDVRNRLKQLSLKYSMGLAEEFMYKRNFVTGTMGNSAGNLVGVPDGVFTRLVDYYTNLRASITGETTTIQTQLNTMSPTILEKKYIKNILLNTLESQFTEITNEINLTINNFSDLQYKVAQDSDILNFLTTHNYDGQYLSKGGGRVLAIQLTATTDINKLTNNYNNTNGYLKNYIKNFVNNRFPFTYKGGKEYLFFTNLIYTKELYTLSFSGNYTTHLNQLIEIRQDSLYNSLLNVDNTGKNGLNATLSSQFKFKLLGIIKSWVRYDIDLMSERIVGGLDIGYETLESNLSEFKNNFNIGYHINSGTTAQNLVTNYLVDRNRGDLR